MRSLAAKKNLYLKAKAAYYEKDKSIMSDAAFDLLEDEIRLEDPKWSVLKATGVSVINKKAEIKHLYAMPSLHKRYPDKIDTWLKKYFSTKCQLVMAKLDGTSLQLTYAKGRPIKLVTRGDGTLGQDISYFIPHLNIPKKVAYLAQFTVRCEALMKQKIFDKKWKGSDKKNKNQFNDSRGMVNGLFNRQLKGKPSLAFKDIDIVVLGVYGLPMLQGLHFADKHKFDRVEHVVLNGNQNTAEGLKLSKTLSVMRSNSEYAMDGLVLCDGNHVMEFKNSDKPSWMIAYKENDISNAIPVTVEKIIYQTSRNRVITPKIFITPTKVGTVMVKHATCHNAAWMIERGIGPGATVLIVRAGDVIPKIVGVKKAAKVLYPSVPHKLVGRYFIANEVSTESSVDLLENFFVRLGIEGLKDKTIAKLYDLGITEISQYISMWHKKKTVSILSNLLKTKAKPLEIDSEFKRVFGSPIPLDVLMVASGVFGTGLGVRKLSKLTDQYAQVIPNYDVLREFIKADDAKAASLLQGIYGYKQASIDLLLRNRKAFRTFLKDVVGLGIKVAKHVPIQQEVKKGPLAGKVVTFTSYRDVTHEKTLEALGATIDKFSAKTNILIYKAGGKASTKLDKAKSKGITVTTFDELAKPFRGKK